MSHEITTLDRRHTGFAEFKYFIKTKYDKRPSDAEHQFNELRKWCWETWGPSKELEHWLKSSHDMNAPCQNLHWAWHNDANANRRIYLKTDQELVLYKLRWE